MNVEETMQWIHATERFGSKLGLSRMKELLAMLGNPQDHLSFLHVAGTNGKGSTVTYLANILEARGLKVGRFISPYILEYRERMQINGEMIPKDTLARIGTRVREAADRLKEQDDAPTEFELNTAMGFCWFMEEQCDIVVLEVGLGGRLDATNVINPPLVSVITRIDYDHTAILGDTLTMIATEKAGILKNGTRLVIYPDQDREALEAIKAVARSQDVPVTVPDREAIAVLSSDVKGSLFRYQEETYRIPLGGLHQILNAITAIEAIRLLEGTPFECTVDTVREGFLKVSFPARMEVIREIPLTLLDGAHNPNGGAALRENLIAYHLTDLVMVAGMLRDKDSGPVLRMMAPFCSHLILTTVDNPRTDTPFHLKEICEKDYPFVEVIPDAHMAVRKAMEMGRPMLVFGSLYLASDVRNILLENS